MQALYRILCSLVLMPGGVGDIWGMTRSDEMDLQGEAGKCPFWCVCLEASHYYYSYLSYLEVLLKEAVCKCFGIFILRCANRAWNGTIFLSMDR